MTMSTSATPETPKFERIRDGIKKLPVTEREWDYAFTYDKELNGRLTQHMDRNLAIRDAFIGRLNEIIDAVNGLATLTQRALGAKANGDPLSDTLDAKRAAAMIADAVGVVDLQVKQLDGRVTQGFAAIAERDAQTKPKTSTRGK